MRDSFQDELFSFVIEFKFLFQKVFFFTLSLMFLCLFQSGANTKELFTLGLGFLYACLSANTNRHCTNHILSTHQKEVWVHL